MQAARLKHTREHLRRSGLRERHHPCVDDVDDRRVGVVEHDVQPCVGERQAERKTHVTAAADNSDVVLEARWSAHHPAATSRG